MNNQARKVIPIHSTYKSNILTGSVVQVISDKITINVAGSIKKAKRAFSCVIDPEPDDIIICSQNNNGTIYVLGIIERPGSQEMSVSFPSDTSIRSNQGSLNISSGESITIASKELNSFSERAIHKSHEAIISYDNIIANGDELHARFNTVRLISNLINTMAKHVIDRFKGYIRKTEDNDMVKSGQMTRQTDGLYAMDSKHTIMNSKESTKIDGKKILMG